MLDIAVDLDGVVWDIMEVFLELYNKIYQENIKFEDVCQWYYFSQERFEAIYPLTLKRIDDYPFLDKSIDSYLLFFKHHQKVSF